jgi:ubiquinone/menaquinone biosynthesis C-methylase UbiE
MASDTHAASAPSRTAKLRRYLRFVDDNFGIDELAHVSTDADDTAGYYEDSYWAYHFVHSKEGAIHMALNPSGTFDRAGYYGQPCIVERVMRNTDAHDVLELAMGRGFSSRYLAAQHPERAFTGIDLTAKHVRAARREAQAQPNVSFLQANFHDLPFADESFDLLFVIESLCHSNDLAQALHEVHRVLRPGGHFIVIDGFRMDDAAAHGDDWATAATLVERSMSVDRFFDRDAFLASAQQTGFACEMHNDLSQAILPTLRRYEDRALQYYESRLMNTLFRWFLPRNMLQNAVAGALMPLTIEQGIHSYDRMTLQKG